MIRMKIPGVKTYRSKGKTFRYHRATGIRLLSPPGTSAFLQEFASAEAKRLGRASEAAGTFGALCAEYRGSPHFAGLAPRTQKDYRIVLDYLAGISEMPLNEWTRGFVKQLRDKAQKEKKRRFANYLIAVLSAMFAWAEEAEIVSDNPVARVKKIKRPKSAPLVNRPWAKEEWEIVVARSSKHVRAVIVTCGALGWRGGEALKAPRDAWDRQASTLKRTAAKSGKEVRTPIPGVVLKALEAIYPHDATTLFVNSHGRPWSFEGFKVSMRKLVRKLEADGLVGKGLTLHGLRHTCATRLREMGFSPRTIADMLGQETEGMALHYSRQADTEVELRGVVKRLDVENRKRKVRQSGEKAE